MPPENAIPPKFKPRPLLLSAELRPFRCGTTKEGHTMSRNALIAGLAGAIALGFSALSAQAASVPMGDGLHSGNLSLVQSAHYRYYRHHHHHRYYGYYYRHHHHHHHRYW